MTKRGLQLSVCTAAFALVAMSSAMAGQEPYVASVGPDNEIKRFYIEPKLYQFTHQTAATDSVEGFTYDTRVGSLAPEVCNVDFDGGAGNISNEVNPNIHIPYGNAGWYQWTIRLPKKPEGNLNIVLQCGLLKRNAYFLFPEDTILKCAGEEGEFDDRNCTRVLDQPGVSGVAPNRVLPKLSATVIAEGTNPNSPPAGLVPFNLTSYRNPGSYAFETNGGGALQDGNSMQLLNGTAGSSIIMKACMPKTILVKKPVTGQLNAGGQSEFDLEEGDLVVVRLSLPRGHTMDVFCNEDSVKIMGLGEPRFFFDRADAEDFVVSSDGDI